MKARSTRALVFGALLALCVGLRADETDPADPATAPFATFVGELKGAPESARVAFVIEGDTFVAYVCSGDQPFNTAFSRWYRGDVRDGKLSATVDGVELVATANGDTVAGALKGTATHEFAAARVPGGANAGLFRAAEKLGDDDVVFGWIVDEKGGIVGTAGKKKGAVQTLPAPKGGGNIGGVVAGQKVPAGKVTGAANDPATGSPKRKFDAAARAEYLQDAIAEQKAAGGNPVQAMVLHQVRRFVAGEQPKTKMEEKTFAALRKAPKGALTEYLKNWDKLPAPTREAFVGPAGKQLAPNKALDAGQAKQLTRSIPAIAKLGTRPAGKNQSGTVKGVNITTIKCIDETNPEAFGSDEVFALHAVIVGTQPPVLKQTGVIREFDDGITKAFAGADAVVMPLAGVTPTPGAEVMVLTNLFEDDGAILLEVLNTLKPLIETAVVIVVEQFAEAKDVPLDDAAKEALRTGVKGVIDGAVAALGNLLVQPLGSDAIVVRPDGTIVSTTGAAKSTMRFRRVKNGDVRHDYELSGFRVQN